MNAHSALLEIFDLCHGQLTSNCTREILEDDNSEPIAVAVYKDGHIVWQESAVSLLLWYVGKKLGENK